MRVLSVSVELHSNFFRGSDILIVFFESHELHVNFSGDVSGCS